MRILPDEAIYVFLIPKLKKTLLAKGASKSAISKGNDIINETLGRRYSIFHNFAVYMYRSNLSAFALVVFNLGILLFSNSCLKERKEGCMDKDATNYDASAKINSGCTYDISKFSGKFSNAAGCVPFLISNSSEYIVLTCIPDNIKNPTRIAIYLWSEPLSEYHHDYTEVSLILYLQDGKWKMDETYLAYTYQFNYQTKYYISAAPFTMPAEFSIPLTIRKPVFLDNNQLDEDTDYCLQTFKR